MDITILYRALVSSLTSSIKSRANLIPSSLASASKAPTLDDTWVISRGTTASCPYAMRKGGALVFTLQVVRYAHSMGSNYSTQLFLECSTFFLVHPGLFDLLPQSAP